MHQPGSGRKNSVIFNFVNKTSKPVAWVTGASSGIGKALALELHHSGYHLILSSRNKSLLEQVAKEGSIPEDDYRLLPFDLADASAQAKTLTEQAMRFFGKIDVLILCGGISQRMSVFESDDTVLRKLMEINFFSYVSLARAVLPFWKERKSGQLVVISSIAGKFGFYLRADYAASKHALHGYFDSFRLETESYGIRTLLVCPGKIKTQISLHALTAEGVHGKMDPSHAHAMLPEVCARKILKAMKKEKEEVWIGGKEILMVYLKNMFPFLFRWLIRKQSPY
jgi:short-subunit dehydrogenase